MLLKRQEKVCKDCGLALVYEEHSTPSPSIRLMHEDPVCDGFKDFLSNFPKPDKVEVVVEQVIGPEKN